jgi:putative methyltransferase (TIGR04325 family)
MRLPVPLNHQLRDRSARPPSIICSGNYATWPEALAASSGYLPEFIERTRQAALRVKNGEAVYERDSVLLEQVQYSFPLLAALLRAAIENDGTLTVFDFGGGFGTSYFQCRQFLKPLKKIRWLIVDQPTHVEYGWQDFQTDELRFFKTIRDVFVEHRPDVLLLSGVLPYVPSPYGLLAELTPYAVRYVIVDRTLFLTRDADRLTLQHGPFELYPGTYPAWFLSESRVVKTLTDAGYELLQSFDGFDDVGPEDEGSYPKGFIFARSSR